MTERSCICGCTTFRFKYQDKDEFYTNICRNCNHTLAEHIDIKKDAE